MADMKRRTFIKLSTLTAGAVNLGAIGYKLQNNYSSELDGSKSDNPEIIPITTKERKERIENAQRLMYHFGIDALFLEPGSSFFYFTGLRWGRSERLFAAIITLKGDPIYICPAFEEERARERILIDGDVRVWQEDENPYKIVVGIIDDVDTKNKKVGIEESVRFFIYDGIRHASPGLELVSALPVTAGCRMIKSDAEIRLMQIANNCILSVYKSAFASMKEGMSQSEFNLNCTNAFNAIKINGKAWVQFGENSALPHGSSRERKLKEGDVVLVDGLASVEAYFGDVSRTIIFGKPNTKQRERWFLARQAQDAAFAEIKPGKACEQIDHVARKLINEAGYGPGYKYFYHRLGHGIGLDPHEWAYLVKGDKTILKPGMCFSNEPGIYVPGEFGVRVEDCFYVTDQGYRAFTQPSPGIDQPFSD